MILHSLRLRVLLPTRILVDRPAQQLTAEAIDGAWCLKPRHMDFVTALQPGILSYLDTESNEHFIALDEGLLVKCAETVSISTQHAVEGNSLSALRHIVNQQFLELDEHQRLARTALARLEAGAIRRFIELERPRHA